MDINEQGLALVESFEGYSYHAYWDAYGSRWTVGYGETSGISSGSTMTRAQAEADLRGRMVRQYEPSIKALGVPLTQNQFNALCSFVWNLGPGSMSYDIGRYLRAREYTAAGNSMMEYTRAGGVVLQGLVNRREAERKLFFTPDPKPPSPYLLFANEKWGRHKHTERKTVELIDGALKHPVKYHGWLLFLYGEAKYYRDRDKRVATAKGGGGWVPYHRGERWQGLNRRLLEIRKATK